MTEATGLQDLERLVVTRSLAREANDHLRRVGQDGYEGFALWAGRRNRVEFRVLETVIPEQRAIRSVAGGCVTVDGSELFRLNVHLHETGLELVAQLHSHPGDAYHSDTDDTFPIATAAGALSIVVPDFAVHPFSVGKCAIYRLVPEQGWLEIPPNQSRQLIRIVDD